MSDPAVTLESLKSKWPSTIVARDRIAEFTGGLLSAGTMANLDSAGDGPPRLTYGTRKVVYPVDGLIAWLAARMTAERCDKMKKARASRRRVKDLLR